MSLKKTITIAAAAGVLTALAMPAMAFENEFHGIYNTKFYLSNIDNGGAATYVPNAWNANKRTNNFFEQRARLQYIAKASEDLKLVTHFELDSNWGGNGSASSTVGQSGYKGMAPAALGGSITNGNNSGQLDSDSITLETKHVYLDFNAGPTNFKVGIQPFGDAFNGVLAIADAAALVTTTKFGPATLLVAYGRGLQQSALLATSGSAGRTGDQNIDLFAINAKYAITKDFNAGLAYYFLADYAFGNPGIPAVAASGTTAAVAAVPQSDSALLLHVLGLYTDAKFGPLSLNAFVATQMGHEKSAASAGKSSTNYHGLAMGYNVKMAVGPGAVKTGLQFTTGDDNADAVTGAPAGAQRTGWRQIYGSANNQTGLMLLSRNDATGGLTNTNFLVGDSGFSRVNISAPSDAATKSASQSRGLILFNLGYDANLTKQLYANFNTGMAWTAKSAGAPIDKKTGKSNGGDLLGTEINIETGYKLYDNLTVRAQAAYVLLGGYYAGSALNSSPTNVKDPDNPYTFRTGLSYTF
jgi:hypothetical protein